MPSKKIKKPTKTYKQNKLFKGDSSRINFNACVGTNGGPYDFFDYGNGYFRAALRLIDSLKENYYEDPIDILIYPIGFLFRHGIELYLKHFADFLPRLLDKERELKLTHNLDDNWKQIKTYFNHIPHFDSEKLEINRVEEILKDFIEIDPRGEVFRFPESKKGQQHLEETTLINVLILGDKMKELKEIFDNWISGLFYLWDSKVQSGY